MMSVILLLFSVWAVGSGFHLSSFEDNGKPLFLTPYIKRGDFEGGRRAAKVQPFFGNIESYSGYLTVNESSNGNMFFWYFPVEEEQSSVKPSPVVLWLQGGPGASSMFGLYYEHGPLDLDKQSFTVTRRQYRWSQKYHMIYVDNPVGAGFSFSDPDGYSHDEYDVRNNLYELLIQFFKLFPHLAENEFFVTGESYAGKYVPAISLKIHEENPSAEVKINLKGLTIGDGVTDRYPLLETRKEGHDIFDDIDHLNDYFNGTYSNSVRKNIHVSSQQFYALNYDGKMNQDKIKIAPMIVELLKNYRVLYYNGANDTTIPHEQNELFLEDLKWSGSSDYRNAKMIPWKVDGEYAGYVRAADSLTYVLFNDAGHTVPSYQPRRAFEMMSKFISNEPIL